MRKIAVNALLLVALVFPVLLFLLLISNIHLNVPIAGVIAIATGWALNVAWAFAAQENTIKDQPQSNANFLSVAARFGWACPAALALLTWLVWRFAFGNAT